MTHDEIIEDVHKRIMTEWSEDDKNSFFKTEWDGTSLTSYHHWLGRWIRNNYNLWSIPWEPEMKEVHGCMCDCSPYHPDQVSQTIIEKVWLKGYTKE